MGSCPVIFANEKIEPQKRIFIAMLTLGSLLVLQSFCTELRFLCSQRVETGAQMEISVHNKNGPLQIIANNITIFLLIIWDTLYITLIRSQFDTFNTHL